MICTNILFCKGPSGEKIHSVTVHRRCVGTGEPTGSMEERVVGLEVKTSSGQQKKLFGCVYPHTEVCGKVVLKELICKEGHEIVGFHSVFSVSIISQWYSGLSLTKYQYYYYRVFTCMILV